MIDESNLELFFKYVAERNAIYERKMRGERFPWTEDEILRKYKFTNVFRELDPGTKYVIEKIIPKCKSSKQAIFNIIIYRLFNKIQTFEAHGLQDPEEFRRDEFESEIRKRSENDKVFTNAFIVSGYGFIEGKDKIEKVCSIIEEMSGKMKNVAAEIETKKESDFTFKKILSLRGIGKFLAYQICVDIGYYDKRLYDEDEHVVCGPGCVNGLKRIFGEIEEPEDKIRYLESIQDEQFAKIGVDFGESAGRKLNLMALENCLCEFGKYMKALKGEGRPRNRYHFPHPVMASRNIS